MTLLAAKPADALRRTDLVRAIEAAVAVLHMVVEEMAVLAMPFSAESALVAPLASSPMRAVEEAVEVDMATEIVDPALGDLVAIVTAAMVTEIVAVMIVDMVTETETEVMEAIETGTAAMTGAMTGAMIDVTRDATTDATTEVEIEAATEEDPAFAMPSKKESALVALLAASLIKRQYYYVSPLIKIPDWNSIGLSPLKLR